MPVAVSGDGTATIQVAEPRILLTSLNANIAANNISEQGRNFGNLTLTANTMRRTF